MCSSCCASKPERDSATIPTCELARLFFYLSWDEISQCVHTNVSCSDMCRDQNICGYLCIYVRVHVYVY